MFPKTKPEFKRRRNNNDEGRDSFKRGGGSRMKNTAKFQLAKDTKIEYKNYTLLQKYLNDRGKIISRRTSGITAPEQRRLVEAIKRARFLALLTTGGVRP